MEPAAIKALVEEQIPGSVVTVEGNGNKYQLIVVSEQFAGLTPVKKQQLVYACINDHIASGDIHAVSIRTMTPEQWDKERKFL